MSDNYHIESDNFKKLPGDFTFGVELEFSGGMTVDETDSLLNWLKKEGLIDEGWSVHFDRSVLDENGLGAEIVSPPLRDNEKTRKELEIITRVIKENGGVMGENTGGHIHFGLQCLGSSVKEIKRFLKLYFIFEPLLYKLSTGDLNHVRVGCRNYAIPLQNRLVNVIDKKAKSLADLVLVLLCNVGANPTHYGENRYYGLNVQRIVEGIRNIQNDMPLNDTLKKLFNGEQVIGKDGKVINPTIEFRFRNGSSNADEIISSARMLGGMMVAAKNMDDDTKSIIQSMYRDAKKRKPVAFNVVTQANRNDLRYRGLTDEEILDKKFSGSVYGNGKIDFNTFKVFMNTINPQINKDKIVSLLKRVKARLKPTKGKKQKNINNENIMENNVYRLAA